MVAHDRGGVNLLVPLLSHWRQELCGIEASFISTPTIEYEVAAMTNAPGGFGGGPDRSLRAVKMAEQSAAYMGRSAWIYSPDSLMRVLDEPWDLVLTGTSLLSSMEKSVWELCRDKSIRCAAICDMWTEYQRRFSNGNRPIMPELLLVIDERMAREARAELGDGFPIKVVGSPHFDRLNQSGRKTIPTRSKIRFISEPIAELFPCAGVHEFQIAETLIATVRRMGDAAPLVLRPHPQDDSEGWRRFAYNYRKDNVQIDDEPSWACHLTTKMAVGLSSMMLIELAIAGIPVASFQPRESDRSYYCLQESEFGIQIIADDDDLADWVASPRPPVVSPSFIAQHHRAIEKITDLILNDNVFSGGASLR